MKGRCILIADAGRAQLLSQTGASAPLRPLRSLENSPGRQHVSELVSDQPGRVDKRCGNMQSAMNPRTDVHEQRAIEFARALAGILDEAASRGQFDELMLVAPPHFLGLMRTHLGPQATRCLVDELPKDLIHMSNERLAQYLKEYAEPLGTTTL